MGKSKGKAKSGSGKSQFVPAPPRTAFDDDEPRIVELPNDYDETQEAAAVEKPEEKPKEKPKEEPKKEPKEEPKKVLEEQKKPEPKKEEKPAAKKPDPVPEKPVKAEEVKKEEKPKVEETKLDPGLVDFYFKF